MQRYPAHMLAQLHAGGSLFLYQGPGALLTQLQPGLVSTLNLETTQGIVLLDRAENEVSERRQNKIDTAILPSLVSLRDPWATAALLSMRGSNAILLNQWSMCAPRNHAAAVAVVGEGVLGAGDSMGKAFVANGPQLLDSFLRLEGEVEQQRAAVVAIEERRRTSLGEKELQEARKADAEAAKVFFESMTRLQESRKRTTEQSCMHGVLSDERH